MNLFHKLLLAVLVSGLSADQAQAHFLWVTQPAGDSQPRTVKVYFGEAAEPDDPALLDLVQAAQVWVLSPRGDEPVSLTLKKEGDALQANLPEDASGTLVLQHCFGVSTNGPTPYLLNYYGKAHPSPLPGSWTAVNDAERLPLEIIPSAAGNKVTFQVRWKGEPAPGSQVTVIGPGIISQLQGETDAAGNYVCELEKGGLFSVRARLIEAKSGEYKGTAYPESRHYSTLTWNFSPLTLTAERGGLADLPRAVTSFGAAVAGDHLYVYGGHFGAAHSYSQEGQSGDFQRLNLAQPGQWEKLTGGPKLTGLAMVAHNGKLYRVGGFTALNKEGEPDKLQSQMSFARFDPQTGAWEELAPLPAGRSSHDAAVVGDTLYVVGGWNMQDGAESAWHDVALACDLTAEQPAWREIAAPGFHRRALSLAEWNGQLYAIGGMQEAGGITDEVAIYDPATNAWTKGPSILASGMDGFGTAAFASHGQLYVSTMSGAVQRLSADGKQWEVVGQLNEPRFFHRQLPTADGLVFVAGASMSVGKFSDLERMKTTGVR